MKIATGYLSRRFLGYFALTLLTFTGLLLGLDLLENSTDVIASGGDSTRALVRYSLLRFPSLVSALIAIAALLAALLTLEALQRHRELLALWSVGLSPWRIMAALLPAGGLLLAAQFLVDDQLVPAASAELRAWGVGPSARQSVAPSEKDGVWLLSDDHVLRVAALPQRPDLLHDLTVFRRDASGNILDRLDAAEARQVDGGWILHDVVRRAVDDVRPEVIAELAWPHPIRLDVLAMLAVDPRELPLSVIRLIIASDGFGRFSSDLYRASFHDRLANPLSPIIMLFLAVGLARTENIRRGPSLYLLSGLALGFGYFIYDGVLLAVAEAGWVPGWLASWSPKIVMTCLISVLVLRT